jgi:osmotically-inducible protein OsmY
VVVPRDDSAITQDVQARLQADPAASGSTIGVETKAGVVSLTGAVTTDTVRTSAEKVARDTPGVRSVDNNVRFGH